MKEKFQQLTKELKKIKKPLIIIHHKPDADALGCSFALKEYLKKQEVESVIFAPDKPARIFEEIFPIDEVVQEKKIEDHDGLVIMDRGATFYRLELDREIVEKKLNPILINIDHHHDTKIKGALNVVYPEVSATSELVYYFFLHQKVDIDPLVAQYLLSGIYGDTGGFRHNNTSPKVLEVCSELLKNGASITKVNRSLFANKSLNTLKLWAIALDRVQVNKKTGMATSFITQEDIKKCQATKDDIAGLAEVLNTVAGSKFSLVLSEHADGKIKASLRSEEYKDVDVSRIARQFHGGGHRLSSGFEIKGRLKQTKDGWIVK